ncbi:MAG: hypothetical protein QNL74_07290 [Rhodobacter sp.]
MTASELVKTKDLAKQLGLPHEPMVAIAKKYGLLIVCGRSKSIKTIEIEELIEHCREKPKLPVCFSEHVMAVRPSTSSKTTGLKSQQALQTLMQRRKV